MSDSTTWAVLKSPCTQYAAVLDFTERIGRRPERVHFDYGLWWLGWVSREEERRWLSNG